MVALVDVATRPHENLHFYHLYYEFCHDHVIFFIMMFFNIIVFVVKFFMQNNVLWFDFFISKVENIFYN